MSIKYIIGGNEAKAESLLGEGRHQLSILKNAMSFQKLKQLVKMVTLPDGTLIKCSSCFGLDVVNVFIPTPEAPVPVIEEEKIITELREYDFSFKLTRGDGRIVGASYDNSYLLITVYNSKEEEIAITLPRYNKTTQYWGFNLEDPKDKDLEGFWISYDCTCGLLTQYPYLYMPEDKRKPEDLVHFGIYEDTIPYWKVDVYHETYPYIPPAKKVDTISPEVAEWIESGKYIVYKKGDPTIRIYTIGFTYIKKMASSVPYYVKFKINSHYFNYQFNPDPGTPIYDVLTPGDTVVCEGPDFPSSPEQQIARSANISRTAYTMEAVPYFTGEAKWLYIRNYDLDTLVPFSLEFAPRK